MKESIDHLCKELQQDLENYDTVILIQDIFGDGSIVKDFLKSIALAQSKKNVKLWSTVSGMKSIYAASKMITPWEETEVLQLYNLYEFSDKFQVLSDESICGGLFNYVKTQWLSLEDVFEALLQ